MLPTPSIGRYAPSPTGMLHLGNLRTAVAAWALARSKDGTFQIRIEDNDQARSRPELIERQLDDLRRLGLDWDGEPILQSSRQHSHQTALDTLIQRRLVYPCFCSRKDIALALSAPHENAPNPGNAYPGTCAGLSWADGQTRLAAGEQHSWRLRVQAAPKFFFDGFQGEVSADLEAEMGDFVVKRADGFFAYQLACAVDDAEAGMTEILRGSDLILSAARQAYIMTCLGHIVPRYLHIPLLENAEGKRLSKREGDDDLRAVESRGYSISAIFSWIAWSLGQIKKGEIVTPQQLAKIWETSRIPCENFKLREEDLQAFNR